MEIIHHADNRYLLRITKDEELLTTLEEFARENNITGAVFHGLGAVKGSHLTLYNPQAQDYAPGREFPDAHELCSLNGNISQKEDGSLFVHAHGTIGNDNLETFGGHFTRATIAATCEIWLEVIPGGLRRAHDEDTQLSLLTS